MRPQAERSPLGGNGLDPDARSDVGHDADGRVMPAAGHALAQWSSASLAGVTIPGGSGCRCVPVAHIEN